MREQVGGTSQANQSAALWCAAGTQQKEEDETEGRTSVCTSIHMDPLFSPLAGTLHNFHSWEDMALL